MNGPEHYDAAEDHLHYAEEEADPGKRSDELAFAQVHATLALAAANAQAGDLTNGIPPTSWDRVLNPQSPS